MQVTTLDERRRIVRKSFVELYQREPKDEDELLEFVVACQLTAEPCKTLLIRLLQEVGLAWLSVRGEESYREYTRSNLEEEFISGLRTFAKGLEAYIFVREMTKLDQEVREKLDAAMKMEVE